MILLLFIGAAFSTMLMVQLKDLDAEIDKKCRLENGTKLKYSRPREICVRNDGVLFIPNGGSNVN
jgi:hypothetical protein